MKHRPRSFGQAGDLIFRSRISVHCNRNNRERRSPYAAGWRPRSRLICADRMLRASLLRLAADEHLLLLTLHHIASDGWSVGVLLRELSKLYEAFRAEKPSPLVELPVQYVDYAHWQRECLQGEFERRLLDYWCEQLRDAPPTLDLPTDWPRPPQQT